MADVVAPALQAFCAAPHLSNTTDAGYTSAAPAPTDTHMHRLEPPVSTRVTTVQEHTATASMLPASDDHCGRGCRMKKTPARFDDEDEYSAAVPSPSSRKQQHVSSAGQVDMRNRAQLRGAIGGRVAAERRREKVRRLEGEQPERKVVQRRSAKTPVDQQRQVVEPHVLQQGQPANPTADPTPPLIKPWEADEDTPTSKLCGMVKRPGVQSVSGNIVESTDIKNSVLLLSHDEKEDVLTAYARQPWFVMADIETLQRVVREDDTATPEDVVAVDAELAKFVGAMASSEDQGAVRVALKRMRMFIRSLSRERPEETPEKKLTLLERHWSVYVWGCIERAQDPTAVAP